MQVYKSVPYEVGNRKGLFQQIANVSSFKYLKFNYSSLDNADYKEAYVYPEAIFQESSNQYFCSLTDSEYDNFLSLEFEDRFFWVTGYVISSNCHDDVQYLMSWDLFASINGIEWEKLHWKDDSEDLAGCNYKWYKIKGGPYRFFKIQQTGPSKGNTTIHTEKMRVAYLDFFGFMSNGKICTEFCRRIIHFRFFHFFYFIVSK